MKNLYITISKKEEDKLFNYITNEFRNSLIEYDETKSKFYFHSRFTGIEEISIQKAIIIYDEKLIEVLKAILKTSYNQIQEITYDETYGELDEPAVYSDIINYVNKCSYNEPESIFEFVANLFYKYLSGHKLSNGNKRLSFLFLINLLRHFGFHFFWSRGLYKDYKYFEDEIIEWVEKSFNMHDKDFNEYIDSLVKWIRKNCVIAIEFRSYN